MAPRPRRSVAAHCGYRSTLALRHDTDRVIARITYVSEFGPSLIRSPMRFPPSLLDEIRARLPGQPGGGAQGRAQARGARAEGPVALQAGEDALLLRQRPQGLLVRLLLRPERRHLQVRHADRRPELPRGRRAAGRGSRRRHAEAQPARGRARGRAHPPLRRAGSRPPASSRRSLPAARRLEARRYLDKRGLAAGAIARFRLGYAPGSRSALQGPPRQGRLQDRRHGASPAC